MRYLDPKNDLTFKRVFGHHPELIKSFLNAILPLKTPIVDIQYGSSELVPDIPELKNTIVDVRCTDLHERQFIVEMQMVWTDTFTSRVLFNASKAYVRQLDRGINYKHLQPVYALSIVNDIFEHDIPDYFHHYKIVHDKYTNKIIDGLELIFIELPKFKPHHDHEKTLNELWLSYLRITDLADRVDPDLLHVDEIHQAVQLLAESSYSKSELEAYDRYWDAISCQKTIEGDAEVRGRKEGREEGLREGKIEVAKRLKAAGVSLDLIAQTTGLSEHEISRI